EQKPRGGRHLLVPPSRGERRHEFNPIRRTQRCPNDAQTLRDYPTSFLPVGNALGAHLHQNLSCQTLLRGHADLAETVHMLMLEVRKSTSKADISHSWHLNVKPITVILHHPI